MIQATKWANITVVPGGDPEGLPIRKTADVIKELKAEGYIVKVYNKL